MAAQPPFKRADRAVRVLPGEPPSSVDPVWFHTGNFGSGSTLVEQQLPYLIIANNDSIPHKFTLVSRAAGGTPSSSLIVAVPPNGGVLSIPTNPFAIVSIDSPNANALWSYSDLPVSGTVISGFISGAMTTVVYDPSGNPTPTAYQGGVAAPATGLWTFAAVVTVAATALTINPNGGGAVSLYPVGVGVATGLSTTVYQIYQYPVIAGDTYTIAGGTVGSASGIIQAQG